MQGKQKLNIYATDVIVVGAGIAGLTCALQLVDDAKASGAPVPRITILEADYIPGGRTKDGRLSNGLLVDEGAHWFHGGDSNPFYQYAQNRYGDAIGVSDDDTAQNRIWIHGEGRYSADLKDIATRQLEDEYAAFKAEHPDQDVSLGHLVERCIEKHDTLAARAFANYMATAWMAADSPYDVSCDEFYKDPNGPGGKTLKGGVARVIDAMVAELRKNDVRIITNTPVHAVNNTDDGVTIMDIGGQTYTAKKAVVTASVGVLQSGSIQFDAGAQAAIDPYLAGITMAHMTKIMVPLAPGFLESRGIKDDTFISVLNQDPMYMCHAGTNGKPVLTLFLGGKAFSALEIARREQLDRAAFAFLDRIPEIDGYRDQLAGNIHVTGWGHNDLTLGAYSAARPGATRSDPIAAGNIIFAGEAFVADPDKSPSQMLGAWHSGKIAAGMISSDLNLNLRKEGTIDMTTAINDEAGRSGKRERLLNAPYKVSAATADRVSYTDGDGEEVKPGRMLNNAMDAFTLVKQISAAKREEVLKVQGYGNRANYKAALLEGMEIVDNDSIASRRTLESVTNDILTPLIPIEDEREDVDGLMAIQKMNQKGDRKGNKIRGTIGNFKEIWIVLRDPQTGAVIGAANTAIYSAKGTEAEKHVHATVNNIYLLVDEAYRGLGVSQILMDARKDAVRDFLKKEYPDVPVDQQKYVMFNEQNDPSRMTMQDILFDSCAGDTPFEKKGSKICQFTRQILFTRAYNNRTLDFPYVQPALGNGEACDTLYYNAFTHGPVDFKDGVPSAVLKQNLKSFFVHSVAKSDSILQTDVWKKQEAVLDSKETIAWSPPIDFRKFRDQVYTLMRDTIMGKANKDLPLDVSFGGTLLKDLGVVPPLLAKNEADAIAHRASLPTSNDSAWKRVFDEGRARPRLSA